MTDGQNTTQRENSCEALLDSATADLYRQNAFRILGLPVTANASDLARQQKRLKLMEKLGATSAQAQDSCLPLIPPPDGDAIRKATHRLHDPELRLIDELFWISPESHQAEDVAIKHLKAGNTKEAIAHWSKTITQGNADGVLATHNLAVLNHALALDIERSCDSAQLNDKLRAWRDHCWKHAYKYWRAVAESSDFWNYMTLRVRELDDPRLTTGLLRRLRQSLPTALIGIGVRLAVHAAKRGDDAEKRRHLTYIRDAGLDLSTATRLVEQELAPVTEQVKMICEPVAALLKQQHTQGAVLARRCLDDTRPLIAALDSILNERHHLRQVAHDAVAATVRSCVIDFGNATNEWSVCRDLLQEARELACDEPLRTRLDDDIAQLDKNLQEQREHETLKNAVTGNHVYEVTIPGGQALVGNYCTCCLGQPNGEQTVSYSWEEHRGIARYKRTRSFGFPICAKCRQHQSEYASKRWLLLLLSAGISGLIALGIATQISAPDWLPFVLGGAVLTTVIVFVLSRMIKISVLAPDHSCRTRAVSMLRATDSDVTFQFHNPLYAQNFARTNKAQVRQRMLAKPSRGDNILSGKTAFASVLISVVIGAIAQSVVFSMMQDYWKSSETSTSGSPPFAEPRSSVNTPPAYAPVTSDSSPSNTNSQLASRIALGKAHARAMETEIQQMDADLSSMSGQIGTYKTEIDGYENRVRLGLGVNESQYQQAIDEHNRLVRSYNARLEERKAKYAEYSQEIDSVNNMVSRYNNGQR